MGKISDHAVKMLFDQTESRIKDIAFNRRAIEIIGGDPEEYDRKMNEWCEKYYDFFGKMDEAGMSKYMYEETLRIIAEAGRSDFDG